MVARRSKQQFEKARDIIDSYMTEDFRDVEVILEKDNTITLVCRTWPQGTRDEHYIVYIRGITAVEELMEVRG